MKYIVESQAAALETSGYYTGHPRTGFSSKRVTREGNEITVTWKRWRPTRHHEEPDSSYVEESYLVVADGDEHLPVQSAAMPPILPSYEQEGWNILVLSGVLHRFVPWFTEEKASEWLEANGTVVGGAVGLTTAKKTAKKIGEKLLKEMVEASGREDRKFKPLHFHEFHKKSDAVPTGVIPLGHNSGTWILICRMNRNKGVRLAAKHIHAVRFDTFELYGYDSPHRRHEEASRFDSSGAVPQFEFEEVDDEYLLGDPTRKGAGYGVPSLR